MVIGPIAGAIRVRVMDRVDWFAYDHEAPAARRRTQAARPGGLDPAHVAANEVAGVISSELSPPQPHPAGIAVHYAAGIGPGAVYEALRDRVPRVGAGRGLLLGLGLSAMQDELMNTASGLSGNPQDFPWQVHARFPRPPRLLAGIDLVRPGGRECSHRLTSGLNL